MPINKTIDHTLLKQNATSEQVKRLCQEAMEYEFASVCINPTHIKLAKEILKDSPVKVCTVIGFPLGANATETKVFETKKAISDGADEVDMVINIGALKEGNFQLVEDDIRAVVLAAKEQDSKSEIIVKVIIETALLEKEEIATATKITDKAKAHFVKTSTGFAGGGATIEDVKLMKSTIESNMLIKASGGIRDLEQAKAMIEAGASRLGASSGVQIMQGLTSKSDY
ncbi:deoxyribose-phosphate aldolase [Halobacteriovorax sp. GB3]|uniref:deoxyribose-phosphate aldolase n=1 Tax=Halobacteriovorax sp. GB3 TaxID=2719615 RepID=UPI003FCD2F36